MLRKKLSLERPKNSAAKLKTTKKPQMKSTKNTMTTIGDEDITFHINIETSI